MVEKLDSDRSTVMLQILIGRSSQQLCRSQHITLDVGWPRDRSAHAHDLPKVGALADGRASTISFDGQSSFRK